MKKRNNEQLKEEFQTVIINKIKEDLRKNNGKYVLTLLIETFDDFILVRRFISWLSSKFDYSPGRLKSLINNTKNVLYHIIHFHMWFLMKYTHFG